MAEKLQIVVIAADFNKTIVEPMIDAARDELVRANWDVEIVRTPGCYEVPLIASLAIQRESVGGLVVLGYIERGETLHGEVMGHVVHSALVEMQIRHEKPVGIGIIGPGATLEQAEVRKVAYARAAAQALLQSLSATAKLQ